jgi:hypothetical protein
MHILLIAANNNIIIIVASCEKKDHLGLLVCSICTLLSVWSNNAVL